MVVTVIQFYNCFYMYIHLHNNDSVYNLEPNAHVQKSTTWLRWFLILSCMTDCLVWLLYVRREASKVWTRYNGGKPGSYSTMHASVHESEMWNNILSARSSSHCNLRKVAYLRCSCLVLSASSCLLIRASWFGLVRLWVVGHCNKTHRIWPMTARNFDLWHDTLT